MASGRSPARRTPSRPSAPGTLRSAYGARSVRMLIALRQPRATAAPNPLPPLEAGPESTAVGSCTPESAHAGLSACSSGDGERSNSSGRSISATSTAVMSWMARVRVNNSASARSGPASSTAPMAATPSRCSTTLLTSRMRLCVLRSEEKAGSTASTPPRGFAAGVPASGASRRSPCASRTYTTPGPACAMVTSPSRITAQVMPTATRCSRRERRFHSSRLACARRIARNRPPVTEADS